MATRFYLHYGAGANNLYVPPITPAYDAEWNKTSSAVRRLMSPSKVLSYSDSFSVNENVVTSPYDILAAQFISLPLITQTISGDVKGIIRCSCYDAAADMSSALVIKVVSADGLTVRGTLYSNFPSSLTSELYNSNVSYRTKWFPASTTMTPVDCQLGDRLVFEVGARAFNITSTTKYAYFHIDDTNATDCPENETSTSAGASWLEFTEDLAFTDNYLAYEIQTDVEYVQDYEFVQADQVQVDVEYEEPNTVLTDAIQVDVEYVDGSVHANNLQLDIEYLDGKVTVDYLYLDVEYTEPVELRIDKIDLQYEVETYQNETTNFIFDITTDLYISAAPGQVLGVYTSLTGYNFIDGIRFNEEYYFLSTITLYRETEICYVIALIKSLYDYNTMETNSSIISLIQTFPKISNPLESMNWYSVWKHSGRNFAEYDGKIWFALTDSPTGYVYSYDGTNLVEEYRDETLDEYVSQSDIKVYNDKLFIAMSDHVLMYDGNTWEKTYPITLSGGEIAAGTYLETYSMCVHDGYLYLSITKKTPNGESCTVNPYLYRYNTSWVVQTLFNVVNIGEGLLFMTSFNSMIYFIAKRGTMSYCSTVNYYDSIAVLNPGSYAVTHLHTSGIGYGAGIYYYYCCLGISNDGNTLLVGGYNFVKEVDNLNTITTVKTITTNNYFVNTINIADIGDLRNGVYWLVSKDSYCCEDV